MATTTRLNPARRFVVGLMDAMRIADQNYIKIATCLERSPAERKEALNNAARLEMATVLFDLLHRVLNARYGHDTIRPFYTKAMASRWTKAKHQFSRHGYPDRAEAAITKAMGYFNFATGDVADKWLDDTIDDLATAITAIAPSDVLTAKQVNDFRSHVKTHGNALSNTLGQDRSETVVTGSGKPIEPVPVTSATTTGGWATTNPMLDSHHTGPGSRSAPGLELVSTSSVASVVKQVVGTATSDRARLRIARGSIRPTPGPTRVGCALTPPDDAKITQLVTNWTGRPGDDDDDDSDNEKAPAPASATVVIESVTSTESAFTETDLRKVTTACRLQIALAGEVARRVNGACPGIFGWYDSVTTEDAEVTQLIAAAQTVGALPHKK